MNIPGRDISTNPVEPENHQMAKYPSKKKQKNILLFSWKLALFEFVQAAVTQYHKLVA